MALNRSAAADKTASAGSLFLIILYLIPSFGLAAGDGANLSGRIRDAAGEPVAGARLTIRSSDALFSLNAVSGVEGTFDLVGIPPGRYALTVESGGRTVHEREGLVFEPGAAFYVRLELPRDGGPQGARAEFIDLSPSIGRTIINELQVRSLPSGDNLWSLLENQDLSATTNRIDVGGVWADVPALWSSRGGGSWAQSAYLLNGLDVTDPYASGTPMFYPDLNSLAYTAHADGRHSIRNLSPGGAFNIVPKQGTAEWHGAATLSFTPSGLTTGRVPERLVAEDLTERTHLNTLSNAAGRVSGPLVPGKLLLFASVSRLDVSRDVAEFASDDKGEVSSGLVNLTYLLPRGSLQFLWTGQNVRQPTYGAGRNVPVESTVNNKNTFNVAQLLFRTRFSPGHALELGASFDRGGLRSGFQDGVSAPHSEEVFKKIPAGAAAAAGSDDRTTLSAFGHGTAALRSSGNIRHHLEYGTSLRYASSSSEDDIFDNLHLRYWDDIPFEIVRYNTPLNRRARALDIHAFASDRLIFANLASLEVGVHAVMTKGWVPGDGSDEVRWTNLSPRVAFSLPLRRDGSMVLGVSAARYFFELPLSYLDHGNPGALGGLAYSWSDANGDGRFEAAEQGTLVRREGPYFSSIDPDIQRPLTDEYCVSVSKVYRGGLYLSLAGYYRETKHLVETLNIGVPPGSSYDPVTITDPGDNFIPGDHDDLSFVVYDQRPATLGRDAFLLTNPDADGRASRYRGLDLTLVKKFSGRTVLFFSGTATEALGTTSPGNGERENDDGVVGALDDNPNAAIEARGRLRFDRAYTARLGWSFAAPGGLRLSTLIKYYDGQPFARKIIVSGFNQGPFFIQAAYRGQARYEFNMTVDLRLEKSVALGAGLARIFIEGYNIFDWANATEESEWTGPEFVLRYATEVQSPRVFRIGLAYEF